MNDYCREPTFGGPCGRRQGHAPPHASLNGHVLDENDDLRAQLAGAVRRTLWRCDVCGALEDIDDECEHNYKAHYRPVEVLIADA